MLDVHPPHTPTHTWRDFFTHIATIVIGLLIAVGLEQTVEYLHHRHQLERLNEALDHEIGRNLQLVAQDITLMDTISQIEEANKVSLEESMRPGSHAPIVYLSNSITSSDPKIRWNTPVGFISASARDSGIMTLLPIPRAAYLARLDLVYANTVELSHQLFDQEYRVRTYAQLHRDLNAMTPQQREEMLLAVAQYQQVASHTRYVLERTRTVLEQDH